MLFRSETFGSLRGTRVGTITVTASVAGVTLEQSIQVGFVPGGIDADSSGVVASVDQTAADGASPVMLTITVKDAGGNPVPAVSSSRLRVVAEPSTGISITQPSAATDGSGQTTASALSSQIGTVTFRATIDGAVLGTTDTVTFVAGDPVASTSVLAADRSLAASDGSENVLLTLTVRDAQGHPVAGVASTRAGFVATPSTGVTLTPAAATTDATGRLTATASCSQAQTVTFGSTLDGATTAGAPQVVFAPHRPDAAHCLLHADPTSAEADGADRVTFTLTVRDDQDRPVAGVAADRLRLTATPLAGLTLTQPTQPTDVSGATTAVLVGTVAGSYACGLTLDGADTEQSVTVTLHPGAVLPSNCRLAADKTAAASDGADTVTLTATLRDALGNPVAGVATGRLALVVNPSSGVQVTGPSRVSDAAGQTTFTVTSSAIANVVCALRVDGLDTAQSVTVAFSTAPPGVDRTRSTLVADRSSAVADGVDTITFTATLRDAQGDPVAGVTADRLALAVDIAGGVTIVGFGASDANGQVTATARSTSLGSRSFTLQVDSQAAATPVAISFTAGAPTADQSTLQASRTSAVANGVDTVALTLTLKDAHGNSVAGVAASEVVLTAEGGLGSGLTLSQPSAASDASGRMTMSVRATAAQAVTLRATLGDLSWTVGITFSEPQPAAGRSTVSISPATIAADGAAETVLTVTLADASGTAIVGSQPADRSVQSSALVVAVASAGEPSDSHGRFQMRLTSRQVGTTQLTVVANGVRLAAVTLTVTGYADVQLAAGLHFVGLPLTPSAESYQSLLGLSGVDAARFDAGTQSYASVGSSYTPGQGLWVRTTAAVSQRLVGTPTPDQPCRLTLRRGWNALANPFARALDWDLASISVEYNGVSLGHLDDTLLWSRLAPYAWVYQSGSGYRLLADTSLPAFASAQGSLPVGSGFWLHAVDDGLTLVLPPPSASRQARKAASPASGDWSVALQASQGGTDVAVQVGMTGAMPSGLRLAMPPTAIGQSAPRLSLLAADGSRLAGDLRGSGQQASWQLELVSASADEVVLTWPGLGRGLPRGLVLSVADLTTGTTTLLNTRAAWRWQPSAAGEVRRLTLTARPGHLARAGIAALELSATRGSAAAISLTLTAPAEVTVQVRGLGGRLVRELSQACEAGTSVLNWDGLDQSGRPVPAGSYRLEAQATSADGAVQKALRTVTIGR